MQSSDLRESGNQCIVNNRANKLSSPWHSEIHTEEVSGWTPTRVMTGRRQARIQVLFAVRSSVVGGAFTGEFPTCHLYTSPVIYTRGAKTCVDFRLAVASHPTLGTDTGVVAHDGDTRGTVETG